MELKNSNFSAPQVTACVKFWSAIGSLVICTQPVINFVQSVDKQSTIRQLFSISLKQRWYYFVSYGKNENRNLATCSSKYELKVASCVEQTANQYWNIAPQHCRVPIKRTSGLTVNTTPDRNCTCKMDSLISCFTRWNIVQHRYRIYKLMDISHVL